MQINYISSIKQILFPNFLLVNLFHDFISDQCENLLKEVYKAVVK